MKQTTKATYITNVKGKKISVILSLNHYQKLLDAKEELDDIRQYDAVKAKNETRTPLAQYLKHRKAKKHAAV